MARALNPFQTAIIRTASSWAARQCKETVANGGSCIDEIHKLYGRPTREYYCAKFVWVVIEQAAKSIGLRNPLPKTAGACDMLQRSLSQKLRVDKTPGIGSVFYRSNSAASSTGHVGVVIDAGGDSVRTVEGNADDKVSDWLYPLSKVREHPRLKKCQRGLGWDFIHIEDFGGSPSPTSQTMPELLTTFGPSFGALALSIGAVAGAFMITQSLRN